MDVSTRHLSVDCPKFANFSLPNPPVKSRDILVVAPSSDNQTTAFPFGPVYVSYGGLRLPDLGEVDHCTSWALQMPNLFPFAGTFWVPGPPAEINFELACASTSPILDTIGSQDLLSVTELEKPYLSKMECHINSLFWITFMGLHTVVVFLPALLPEGTKPAYARIRKIQATGFAFLLFLHSQLCITGSLEDFLAARITSLLSGYEKADIDIQITKGHIITLFLPMLWQFVATFRRTKAPSRSCKLRCRLAMAVKTCDRDAMVPFSARMSWFKIPITETDIYLHKVMYASLFPVLGMVLAWPVEGLRLPGTGSPVPFVLLLPLYRRIGADTLDEWDETRVWRDVGREKRLQDAPEDGSGADVLEDCARCDPDRYTLIR